MAAARIASSSLKRVLTSKAVAWRAGSCTFGASGAAAGAPRAAPLGCSVRAFFDAWSGAGS